MRREKLEGGLGIRDWYLGIRDFIPSLFHTAPALFAPSGRLPRKGKATRENHHQDPQPHEAFSLGHPWAHLEPCFLQKA